MTVDEELSQISATLKTENERDYRAYHNRDVGIPSRKEVIGILKNIQCLLFPAYYKREENEGKSTEELMTEVFYAVKRQISAAVSLDDKNAVLDTEELAMKIIRRLPAIREMLKLDIEALYEGDPAATGKEEIILCYPGFYAISIYRIAHEFYVLKIPYLSRMMTEYAHEKTGIDIHAGATVGSYFFIDHGTGIVIGETTVIGDRVKLYQGVTLGAKSFELDENGNPVKGIKRHPNIGNGVVIYANATILGGRTTIGDGCVIGANVWITHSVEAGKVVSNGK